MWVSLSSYHTIPAVLRVSCVCTFAHLSLALFASMVQSSSYEVNTEIYNCYSVWHKFCLVFRIDWNKCQRSFAMRLFIRMKRASPEKEDEWRLTMRCVLMQFSDCIFIGRLCLIVFDFGYSSRTDSNHICCEIVRNSSSPSRISIEINSSSI